MFERKPHSLHLAHERHPGKLVAQTSAPSFLRQRDGPFLVPRIASVHQPAPLVAVHRSHTSIFGKPFLQSTDEFDTLHCWQTQTDLPVAHLQQFRRLTDT
jgi:hypothetical protein